MTIIPFPSNIRTDGGVRNDQFPNGGGIGVATQGENICSGMGMPSKKKLNPRRLMTAKELLGKI